MICVANLGFGESFLTWLSVLYFSPTASVYDGFSSTFFPIFWGTLQGCPLSPAPFILALEPLSSAHCVRPNITWISYADVYYNVNLFADDALLILSTPPNTMHPNLHALLSRFAVISGLQRWQPPWTSFFRILWSLISKRSFRTAVLAPPWNI